VAGRPDPGAWFTQRVVVGVGELAVSNTAQAILSTYALGSCVGVAAYDADLKVGGILHFMLPDSRLSPAKASAQPAMFADTGLRHFFAQLRGLGARPARLQLFVAGGARVISGEDPFRIGARNADATIELLGGHGYTVDSGELGGNFNRTLHLALASGHLTLKTPHAEHQVDLSPGPALAGPPPPDRRTHVSAGHRPPASH
jgi:chemotaxis protein CheD